MVTGFDTNRDCRPFLPWLKSQGFRTAIRYYTALATAKRLTRPEAEAISRAGFTLAVVYQDRGNAAEAFNEAAGRLAGRRAHDYALGTIGQPRGSAIYFSVDYDASANDLRDHIVPFFRGVNAALRDAGAGEAPYAVGAYGSGLTNSTLLDAGLTTRAWLSMSMGHRGSRDFHAGGRWNLHQKLEVTNASTPAGPFGYDPDEIGPAGCGDFSLEADTIATVTAPRFRVIARDGLRLRGGPGTDFEKLQTLPHGTELSVLGRSGDWALVDLQGDGQGDGHCHASFLAPV